MEQQGWTSCRLDENLFYKFSVLSGLMMVGTYVDNILSSYHLKDLDEFMQFVDAIQKGSTEGYRIRHPSSATIVYDQPQDYYLSHHQSSTNIIPVHRSSFPRPARPQA